MTRPPISPLRLISLLLAMFAALMLAPAAANALPAFAQQTGMDCASCHVGGFGPQLTAYGQAFKIEGYGALDKTDGKAFNARLSAMLVGDYSQTAKDQPSAPARGYDPNNNLTLQETSVFLGGRLAPGFGGLGQVTYSGVDRALSWDNVDLRFVKAGKWGGKDAVFGVSLNNNPTVQDPWNSTPAWSFPYHSPDLAPGRAASPLVAGGLEQQVVGLTPYAWIDRHIYVEAGAYVSPGSGFLDSLGVSPDATLAGAAPYWRLGYTHAYKGASYSAGVFGLNADLRGGAGSAGLTDHYADLGFDTTYMRDLGDHQTASFNLSYVRERTNLAASVLAGDAMRQHGSLNSLTADAAYYRDNVGLTVGYFRTTGSSDGGLFAPGAGDGSRTGRPDSSGMTLQLDFTPTGAGGRAKDALANVRLGAQYTAYSTFNGASTNYDGFGRKASDNNTLSLFVWSSF